MLKGVPIATTTPQNQEPDCVGARKLSRVQHEGPAHNWMGRLEHGRRRGRAKWLTRPKAPATTTPPTRGSAGTERSLSRRDRSRGMLRP